MIQQCLHYNYNKTETCSDTYEKCAKQTVCDGLEHHCFVVWSNISSVVTPISSGCHPPYPSSPNEPCDSECIGRPKGPRYYCCCTGDLCNQTFRLPEAVPQLAAKPAITVNPKVQHEDSHLPNYWLVLPILLCVAFAIAYVFRIKRKSHVYNRNSDDGINPMDYIQDNRRAKPVDQHYMDKELNELRNNNDVSMLVTFQTSFNNSNHFLSSDTNNNNATNLNNSFHQHHYLLNQDQHRALPSNDERFTLLSSTPNRVHQQGQQTGYNIFSSAVPKIDLNDIQLLELVGRGRFGEVCKARLNDNEIAVKIIGVQDQQSWLNEIQVYTFHRVKHINVLNFVYADKHIESGNYWLVVEYASKGSLYSYMKHNLMEWPDFRKIALGIVHGLSHLHEADVAHRDFKSKNVLLRGDLTPCVTDFGVAAILDSRAGSHIDQKKKFLQVGTPRYMAPEVLECSVTFTKASFTKIDIYALSLVLWELVSRCRPLSRPNQSYPAEDQPIDDSNAPTSGFIQQQQVNLNRQSEDDLCDDQLSLVEPFKLPFQDLVGTNPDIETMRQVVVVEKIRPQIQDHWREYPTAVYCRAIEDGWEYDYDARISASCYVERLESLPHNIM